MFKCERCGSGYSATHLGVENCPRCLLLDRVRAPLTFKVFQLPEQGPPGLERLDSRYEPDRRADSWRRAE